MALRRVAISCVAFVLGGCATAAEGDGPRKAWGDCVMRAVQRFDDGKTDPASLALGIAGNCASEYSRLTETMVDGQWTDAARRHMRFTMAENEPKLITSAILTWRNRGKN